MKNLVMARNLMAMADHILRADSPPRLPTKSVPPPLPTKQGAPAPAGNDEKARLGKIKQLVTELPLVIEEVLPSNLDNAKKQAKIKKITEVVQDQLMNASVAKQLIDLAKQLSQ